MTEKIRTALLALLAILLTAAAVVAAQPLLHAPRLVSDPAALQNGARLFAGYCMSCHSAGYVRYEQLRGIGLDDGQIRQEFLVAGQNMHDVIRASIEPEQARQLFGSVPPDLSLIARSSADHGGSGADFLYTFLHSYYPDPARQTGWNNLLVPGTAMPNVLAGLQGMQQPEYETLGQPGAQERIFKGWKELAPGTLTAPEFDRQLGDLVAFLQWMSEPGQQERRRVGIFVMLFMLVAVFVTWRLRRAYWRDGVMR